MEVSYGTTAATLLYKITVYAGTESSYTFEDKDASFVYAENAKTVTKNGDYFTVTFEDGAEYAYVYVAVTHAISYDADGEYKARNFIGSQGAETTVTEKDPNKLTINFADFVKKELPKGCVPVDVGITSTFARLLGALSLNPTKRQMRITVAKFSTTGLTPSE